MVDDAAGVQRARTHCLPVCCARRPYVTCAHSRSAAAARCHSCRALALQSIKSKMPPRKQVGKQAGAGADNPGASGAGRGQQPSGEPGGNRAARLPKLALKHGIELQGLYPAEAPTIFALHHALSATECNALLQHLQVCSVVHINIIYEMALPCVAAGMQPCLL